MAEGHQICTLHSGKAQGRKHEKRKQNVEVWYLYWKNFIIRTQDLQYGVFFMLNTFPDFDDI